MVDVTGVLNGRAFLQGETIQIVSGVTIKRKPAIRETEKARSQYGHKTAIQSFEKTTDPISNASRGRCTKQETAR